MIVRFRVLLAALLLVVVAPRAGAAEAHTLTLVMDKTGSMEVVLPTFSIDTAAMTETAKGVAGLVLERLGEPFTIRGNRVVAESARLDADRPMGSFINFHVDDKGNDLPFEAGRYRLSTTAAGGASAVVTLGVSGFNRDITVLPAARPRLSTGSAQRLDTAGATGTFQGHQRLSRGTVKRAYALVSVGEQTSGPGGFVGQNQSCLTGSEGDCGVPFGFASQFVSAGPFGNFITSLYGPDQVPAGQVFGHQRVSGVSSPSRAWGWGILIDAGP